MNTDPLTYIELRNKIIRSNPYCVARSRLIQNGMNFIKAQKCADKIEARYNRLKMAAQARESK